MSHTAVMLHNDAEDVSRVERLLAGHSLSLRHCNRVEELERILSTCLECLVLLNLDAYDVTNEMLRRMSQACPQARIIGMSERPYHPELELALRSNLLAVVARPINEEELGLCLKGAMDV